MEATPRINYILLLLCAGQSITVKSENWYLLNEFDSQAGFYRKITIENLLRDLAHNLPNTYVIGWFSCFRKIIEDRSQMENCISAANEPKADKFEIEETESVLKEELERGLTGEYMKPAA